MYKNFDINVKLRIACRSEEEARAVKSAIENVLSGHQIIGSDLLSFDAFYKRNEATIKPVLNETISEFKRSKMAGFMSITKNIFKLKNMS